MYDKEGFKNSRPEAMTPQYIAWRNAVLKRDGFKCQLTGSKERLTVHHIRPWAKYPHMRYLVANGITITEEMHDMITGREQEWAEKLSNILKERYYIGSKKKRKWKPRDWSLRF